MKTSTNYRGWSLLTLGSAALAAVFMALHLPAALLLGSMLVAIAMALHAKELVVPPTAFALAQGLLGCLMAHTLRPSVFHRVLHDWPLFAGITVVVLLASAVLGYVLVRAGVLPGTTAIWGLAPGAASAMVVLADSYGADARLVALMQYLRVVLVTALAAAVAGVWGHRSAAALAPAIAPQQLPTDWLAWHSGANIAATLALVLFGLLVAKRLRMAAGALLVPLVLGIALQTQGVLTLELPPSLMACAYAVVGWSVGLRFTRAILLHAWQALPHILWSIAAIVAVGVVLAIVLNLVGGVEPLTAYLATSPGGADSVAVISASAAVDSGFVMAMQLARFAMLVVAGPRIYRWIAQRAQASP